MGEAALAGTLAARLPADLPLLLTTITPTGQAQASAAAARLGDRAIVAYLPFELGFAIARFFRRFSPASLVLVEGDFWPLLLRAVQRRGIPTAVVNGRVSDRSFVRLQRFRALALPLFFAPIDRFGVQTEIDAERLLALGVPAERVTVTGNLKFDSPEPPANPELAATARTTRRGPADPRRRLDHGGRRGAAARGVPPPRRRRPDGRRARHAGPRAAPSRALRRRRERLATEVPGFVRRSGPDRARPPLFLLDSIGELAATYRLATAAFVGGTLQPTGGHNPIEAARFGVPVAVGPSMTNFREIAELFDQTGAWARVASGRGAGQALGGLARRSGGGASDRRARARARRGERRRARADARAPRTARCGGNWGIGDLSTSPPSPTPPTSAQKRPARG